MISQQMWFNIVIIWRVIMVLSWHRCSRIRIAHVKIAKSLEKLRWRLLLC